MRSLTTEITRAVLPALFGLLTLLAAVPGQLALAADEGMLFPQAQPRVMSMWMKNTYIPLDMLFIDSRGRIVCLLANTRPQSLEILSCAKPAKAVLEIGGGEAAERGIRVGDQVIHKMLNPSAALPQRPT